MTHIVYIILCAGAVCMLITALIRTVPENTRGLVCWTVSSLTTAIALLYYFVMSDGFSIDVKVIPPAAAAFGAVLVLILIIEFFAPSKRFKKRDKAEYDADAAERSLNVVFAITAAVLCAVSAASDFFGEDSLLGLCLIPALAISVRQLSYCLYCSRISSKNVGRERDELLRRLKSGNKEL